MAGTSFASQETAHYDHLWSETVTLIPARTEPANRQRNLELAVAHLQSLHVSPGQVFSFWKSVPAPTFLQNPRVSQLHQSPGGGPEPFAGREAARGRLPPPGGDIAQEDGSAQAVPVGPPLASPNRTCGPPRPHSLDGQTSWMPSQPPGEAGQAKPGIIMAVQSFGSELRAHVHFHILVTDG